MLDSKYLQAIVDYEINIEFCEKIVWLRPRTEGLSFLSEDVGIKLKGVGGDKMLAVKKGIDGTKKSGEVTCDLPIPDGLFEREIFLNLGRSMLRRFQMEGETLENEVVSDRLLLTY